VSNQRDRARIAIETASNLMLNLSAQALDTARVTNQSAV
jgi:hypothetical protein